MQKKVHEKPSQSKASPEKRKQDTSNYADRAFVLAQGDSFSKTVFTKSYHETFGVTLAAAKEAFERLLASEIIAPAQQARHYTRGPGISKQEDLVRLVGNRTGEFKIRSLKNPDKIVEGVKSSNPHHGLLPGDVVYGAYVNDDYGFAARILVSRALREPVCTINYAKSAGVEGCGSSFANRLDKNAVKKLQQQFFTMKIDESCCKPFSAIVPLTGTVGRVIGPIDSTQSEIDMTLARLGIPSDFSDEAQAQAQALPDAVESDKEIEERVDLRDVGLVTIDGEPTATVDRSAVVDLVEAFNEIVL